MNRDRVDELIKFALAAAGEEDFDNRELGPIHVLKYVYLGDLAFAEKNDGQTFTGAPWRFHHFGPWAESVYERIAPIVASTGAEEKRITSKYADDFVRWVLRDEDLYKTLESKLPFQVTRAMKRAIHKFGRDTGELLDFVYKTRPMLTAAPGEVLSFAPPSVEEHVVQQNEAPITLSIKQQKRRREALADLKAQVRAKLDARAATARAVVSVPPPRYDDVYADGQQWLDSLAGEPIESSEGELLFSDEVWKSSGRRGPDVP